MNKIILFVVFVVVAGVAGVAGVAEAAEQSLAQALEARAAAAGWQLHYDLEVDVLSKSAPPKTENFPQYVKRLVAKRLNGVIDEQAIVFQCDADKIIVVTNRLAISSNCKLVR